jgi:hypothetical protein
LFDLFESSVNIRRNFCAGRLSAKHEKSLDQKLRKLETLLFAPAKKPRTKKKKTGKKKTVQAPSMTELIAKYDRAAHKRQPGILRQMEALEKTAVRLHAGLTQLIVDHCAFPRADLLQLSQGESMPAWTRVWLEQDDAAWTDKRVIPPRITSSGRVQELRAGDKLGELIVHEVRDGWAVAGKSTEEHLSQDSAKQKWWTRLLTAAFTATKVVARAAARIIVAFLKGLLSLFGPLGSLGLVTLVCLSVYLRALYSRGGMEAIIELFGDYAVFMFDFARILGLEILTLVYRRTAPESLQHATRELVVLANVSQHNLDVAYNLTLDAVKCTATTGARAAVDGINIGVNITRGQATAYDIFRTTRAVTCLSLYKNHFGLADHLARLSLDVTDASYALQHTVEAKAKETAQATATAFYEWIKAGITAVLGTAGVGASSSVLAIAQEAAVNLGANPATVATVSEAVLANANSPDLIANAIAPGFQDSATFLALQPGTQQLINDALLLAPLKLVGGYALRSRGL